jgi:hypothetical protein
MTKLRAETVELPNYRDHVAAGFFFFGFAVAGSAGSDPRSTDVSRPAVKV